MTIVTVTPPKPLSQLARSGRALASEVPRTLRRLASVPRVLRQARDVRVGTTPHDIVIARGTFKLLRFRRETPAVYAEPVLVCYALVNRPYILDLLPDKSVVQRYLQRGFDVYMIDWGVPSDGDRSLIMEDYVCGFLNYAYRYLQRNHAQDQIHLLGYCMGGTFATLFTALFPERVRTLTLLASPIDFSNKESLLSVWADPKCFDVDAFVDARGNCPASFLQYCFLLLKPIQNVIEKRVGFYERMDDPSFVTNYFALERWVTDNIPVAGETFRDFVRNLVQRNELVRGEFWMDEQRVDLSRIACPLLLLTAENDHLVPPDSTNGIRPHVSSDDVTSITVGSGHVGLVVGGTAHKTVWSEATTWLANRSTPAEHIATEVTSDDFSSPTRLQGETHGS